MNLRTAASPVVLLLVITDSVLTQDVCGGKYLCGFGARCIHGFCECTGSTTERPWVLIHNLQLDGLKLSYCQKPCEEDSSDCPVGATCQRTMPNRFYSCACPEGKWLPSVDGPCTDRIPTTLPTSSTGRAVTTDRPVITTTPSQGDRESTSAVASSEPGQTTGTGATQTSSSITSTVARQIPGTERCGAHVCGHAAKCVSDNGDCMCEYHGRNNYWTMQTFNDILICVKVCWHTTTTCPANTTCGNDRGFLGLKLCECSPGFIRSGGGECMATEDVNGPSAVETAARARRAIGDPPNVKKGKSIQISMSSRTTDTAVTTVANLDTDTYFVVLVSVSGGLALLGAMFILILVIIRTRQHRKQELPQSSSTS